MTIMQNINKAVAALKAGQLIAFPTETVYGLGANASDVEAVKRVFATKGRPADHPVIVHIASTDMLNDWARDIPQSAFLLAEKFWPGPLTLILKKQPHVSPYITGGLDTIGLRIPNQKLTLKLLQEFGGAIVGPSANKYGAVSPTTAEHVANDLNDDVSVILDGGACEVGIESTIVDLSGAQPIIRRFGAITKQQIADLLQQNIAVNTSQPGAPGTTLSHYAPNTPMFLIDSDQLQTVGAKSAVMSFIPEPAHIAHEVYWLQATDDPTIYAHDLYANLRLLDKQGKQRILVQNPPNTLEWQAIKDRLNRASSDFL